MCMITLNCIDPVLASGIAPSDHSTDPAFDNNLVPFQTMWKQDASSQIQHIKSWPNPVSETLYLSFESEVDQSLRITFLNLLHQVVAKNELSGHAGENIHPIDITSLPTGSYLMTVESNNEKHSKVIVILRDE